jgi:hypothetical protein
VLLPLDGGEGAAPPPPPPPLQDTVTIKRRMEAMNRTCKERNADRGREHISDLAKKERSKREKQSEV